VCAKRPQLILENARLYHIDDELLDRDFEFMVRDVSGYALQLPWWSPAGSNRQPIRT
jgi:hypothetical protein